MEGLKTENIFIGSIAAKAKAIYLIDEIEISAGVKVTISDTKGKSARCLGLQWMWCGEVAKSGIGRFDTKENVHRQAKWRWAVPLLKRDDEEFAYVWPGLLRAHGRDKKIMEYIVDEFVSTQGPGFAISEYLTDFERYWREVGVNLTIPDDGLLEWATSREAI